MQDEGVKGVEQDDRNRGEQRGTAGTWMPLAAEEEADRHVRFTEIPLYHQRCTHQVHSLVYP